MIRFSQVRCRCLFIPDLTLPEGHTTVIGPNGSGKSTFLALCAGFLLPDEGQVEIDHDTPRRKEVGYMGEFPERGTLFSRVRDEIASPLRFSKTPAQTLPARVDALAQLIGISHLLDRPIRTLSGGEIALVTLATALVTRPPVLVLDEFDSHLDMKNAQQVMDAIGNSPLRHLIQCTQNMDLAARAGYILFLQDGKVILQGRADDVFPRLRDTCFYPPSWRFSP